MTKVTHAFGSLRQSHERLYRAFSRSGQFLGNYFTATHPRTYGPACPSTLTAMLTTRNRHLEFSAFLFKSDFTIPGISLFKKPFPDRLYIFYCLISNQFARALFLGHSFTNRFLDGAKKENNTSDDQLFPHSDVFYRLLIDRLQAAGALDRPGPMVDPGGPGMTSSVSLLFTERPTDVVDADRSQVSADW
ncbi:hypothetical protein [Vannielia litorea]|uniref:hypothetical protein n=1 Tax=Vannielia litorea TaxID=1217970 RepID=UPI001BCBE13D|nr:hypothetical protein [Vannielia litorea]